MIAVLNDQHEGLWSLCKGYGVSRLDVFGSAASVEEFNPAESDIDLLVEFLPDQELGPWLCHYFEFKQALEELFGYPIDLVMATAMKNSYFIQEVNRTRKELYAAQNNETSG